MDPWIDATVKPVTEGKHGRQTSQDRQKRHEDTAVRDGAKPPKKQSLPWDMGFTPQTWAEKVDWLLTKYTTRGKLAKDFALEEFQEMARRADLYDAEHSNDGDAVFRGSNDR